MKVRLLNLIFVVIICFSCTAQDENDNGSVVTLRITNDKNKHHAFTDLVYFDNQFFLVFRESDSHAFGKDGIIKMLNSFDGKKWKLIKEFNIDGIDLRDPKFSINKNELMLYIHGSTYEGKAISQFTDYRARYSDSWSKIENVKLDKTIKSTSKVTGNEAWPWRITWLNGKAYAFAYNGVDIFGLYNSDDGLFYKNSAVKYNKVAMPTEGTLVANSKGEFYALVRRNYGSVLFQKFNTEKKEFLTLGELPYANFGGPNFVFLNDKQILFSGSYGAVLVGIYDLETNRYKILYNFGGGDCGYPGMLIKDNVLWLSYYSSAGSTKDASIFITKIKLENFPSKF